MKTLFFFLMALGLLLSPITIFSKNVEEKPLPYAELTSTTAEKLLQQVERIKKLVRNNPKYNQEIAFFIDMQVMSGKNRFFIYDLKNDLVLDSGLVAHGFGSRLNHSALKVQRFVLRGTESPSFFHSRMKFELSSPSFLL
jgi:hypothetical protein